MVTRQTKSITTAPSQQVKTHMVTLVMFTGSMAALFQQVKTHMVTLQTKSITTALSQQAKTHMVTLRTKSIMETKGIGTTLNSLSPIPHTILQGI
jgi:hypothetical protein